MSNVRAHQIVNFRPFVKAALLAIANFTANAGELADLPPSHIAKALDAVVSLTVKTNAPSSSTAIGSGMLVRQDGLILTSARLLELEGRIEVETHDGRNFVGQKVGSDKISGIALVRIDGNGLKTAELGQSLNAKVGDTVWALGRLPKASGVLPIVARGRISADLVARKGPPFVESTALLSPGMDGGPLLHEKTGKVIGINGLRFVSATNTSIAVSVPVETFERIKDELLSIGRVRYGSIGMTGATALTKEQAETIGFSQAGVLIRSTRKAGPENSASLEVGDVVFQFDGKPIDDPAELMFAIRLSEPGKTKAVHVFRRGTVLELQLPVVEMPR